MAHTKKATDRMHMLCCAADLVESMRPKPPPPAPHIITILMNVVYDALEIHADNQLPYLDIPMLCRPENVGAIWRNTITNQMQVIFKMAEMPEHFLLLPPHMQRLQLADVKRVVVDDKGLIYVQQHSQQ